MLTSLLYVSRSRLASGTSAQEVDQLVSLAVTRNARLDVTGALIFTGGAFAQVLEGPSEAIDRLMTSISQDPRHDRIVIVQRVAIDERSFARWAMSYSGPLTYLAMHLQPFLRTPDDRNKPLDAADQLIDVMRELTH